MKIAKGLYPIVDIDYSHPSFNWANGRYIIVEETNDDYRMCRLIDGKPETHENGEWGISITGNGNKGITWTGRYYNERELKLKRILK